MGKLNEVKTIEDVIDYLETKARGHKNYYHYTTWDSLVKIYKTKSFLLTKGNSLMINDQHEAKMKGAVDIWNKTYIGSFSYGSSENMAMWGLYGLPAQDAVRIAIPQKAMLNWINQISSIYRDKNRNGLILDIKKSLTDVVYIEGKRGDAEFDLSCGYDRARITGRSELSNMGMSSKMTGYIKNYAWKYEDEVRIKIELPQEYGYEKILVDIPDETIDSFSITTGPCFQHEGDELYGQLESDGRIKKSGFEGLLRYKELCSMCRYTFERKENR